LPCNVDQTLRLMTSRDPALFMCYTKDTKGLLVWEELNVADDTMEDIYVIQADNDTTVLMDVHVGRCGTKD